MHSIATIISYCTNDYRFIGKCIAEAKKFSRQIIIPVCDHFFDGTLENRALLEMTYREHPDCLFIEFSYLPGEHYLNCRQGEREMAAYWNGTARYIGYLHLLPDIETVLFLDCDEIAEGDRFLAWLDAGEYRKWDAIRLAAYYYVLRPDYRATKVQEISLMVKASSLLPHHFFQGDERFGMFQRIEGLKSKGARGRDLLPLIHHYSWVRPLEECRKKANSWSHSQDRDWPSLIQEAFCQKGSNLFGMNLAFESVEKCYFDPLSVKVPKQNREERITSSVKKVARRDILKIELEREYGVF